jgi:trehalose utilization protein
MIRVTIWNEFRHEISDKEVKELYPDGMHGALQKALQSDEIEVRTAYLDQDENHGLSDEVLNNTDVLLWWGHMAHGEVKDSIVNKVVERVLNGMGFIPLHSAHASKPFGKLMGTSCSLLWRDAKESAHVWCVNPSHPIAAGVPLEFKLEYEEMYGEFFNIPAPDELIFITWFKGGNVFRGGCTFRRGQGKIFYFHPGHEFYPSFYNENVIKVIKNAIHWAAPADIKNLNGGAFVKEIEVI